jgi:hypothetical protein
MVTLMELLRHGWKVRSWEQNALKTYVSLYHGGMHVFGQWEI